MSQTPPTPSASSFMPSVPVMSRLLAAAHVSPAASAGRAPVDFVIPAARLRDALKSPNAVYQRVVSSLQPSDAAYIRFGSDLYFSAFMSAAGAAFERHGQSALDVTVPFVNGCCSSPSCDVLRLYNTIAEEIRAARAPTKP